MNDYHPLPSPWSVVVGWMIAILVTFYFWWATGRDPWLLIIPAVAILTGFLSTLILYGDQAESYIMSRESGGSE